jgi:hypothetical protein
VNAFLLEARVVFELLVPGGLPIRRGVVGELHDGARVFAGIQVWLFYPARFC